MKPRLWQAVAVAYGVAMLVFLALNCVATVVASSERGFYGTEDPSVRGTIVVTKITNRAAIDGPLAVGDRVRLQDSSLENRLRLYRERLGDRFAFVGSTQDGRPLRFVATIVRAPAAASFWSYALAAFSFAIVGLVVAVRRPADAVARKLVFLLFTLGTLFVNSVPWLPAWTVFAVLVVHLAAQVLCAYAGLALATTFPAPSPRGIRRWLQRANPWYAIVSLTTIGTSATFVILLLRAQPAWLTALGIAEMFAFFVGLAVAFIAANREARGADAKRVRWVTWTLAVGFSGTLLVSTQFALHIPLQDWEEWVSLTLVAIPLGLAYAIVRHRVVDIGFVINRALVFGAISAIVVVAFMILEWALSSVAVRVSHITSTSLELALALVLGFSLRSIHARVDRIVDDLFFRDRHEAEQALRTLAREVAFVTEPQVAVARVHAELIVRTGAAFAAIYVVDGPLALRVDPSEASLPAALDVDDPALVRLRATRNPCGLHHVATALDADHAFPLLVRDAVTGFIVLGPKSNGEAYAPDELATIETVALALGNALDALQTAALKAEIARVLTEGAPLDALRRTADSARWAQGRAQPAGQLAGLSE